MKHSLCVMSAVALLLSATPTWGEIIDPGFPAGPHYTFDSPITWQFRTSWDGLTWSEEEMTSIRNAIDYLGSFFVASPLFVEIPVGDVAIAEDPKVTIRKAGADFFKDWGAAPSKDGRGNIDLDISKAIGFAAKDIFEPPWDPGTYPMGEIYINNTKTFSSSPTAPLPDGAYHLPTVTLHEMQHMLSVNSHAEHRDEVMYESIEPGEIKQLQESDKKLLKDAGYNLKLVPEPGSTAAMLAAGVVALFLYGACFQRRLRACQ